MNKETKRNMQKLKYLLGIMAITCKEIINLLKKNKLLIAEKPNLFVFYVDLKGTYFKIRSFEKYSPISTKEIFDYCKQNNKTEEHNNAT